MCDYEWTLTGCIQLILFLSLSIILNRFLF